VKQCTSRFCGNAGQDAGRPEAALFRDAVDGVVRRFQQVAGTLP